MTGEDTEVKQASLLTVSALARYLSVSRSLIYRWVEDNEIPHYRFGRAVRFDPSEVKEWLDSQRVESKSQGSPNVEFERDVDKILRSTIMKAEL